jgi:hypothetical protein
MSHLSSIFAKHRVFKVALITATASALFLFAYTWIGLHAMDIYMWSQERAAIAYDKEILASQEKLAQLERSDTYGSTTPEGTLLLLIDALAQNDPVLASKYYYVLDQETALKDYQAMLAKDGSLKYSEEYYRDLLSGIKTSGDENRVASFQTQRVRVSDEYVTLPNNPKPFIHPKGSTYDISVGLRFTQSTGLWKVHE